MTLREFLELVTHLSGGCCDFTGVTKVCFRQQTRDHRWFSCFLPFLKAHGPIFGPERLPRLPFPARLSTRAVYVILQGCPLKAASIPGLLHPAKHPLGFTLCLLDNSFIGSHLFFGDRLFSETMPYTFWLKKKKKGIPDSKHQLPWFINFQTEARVVNSEEIDLDNMAIWSSVLPGPLEHIIPKAPGWGRWCGVVVAGSLMPQAWWNHGMRKPHLPKMAWPELLQLSQVHHSRCG